MGPIRRLVNIFVVVFILFQAYGNCADPPRTEVEANLEKINSSITSMEELLVKYRNSTTNLGNNIASELGITDQEISAINDDVNFKACQKYYNPIKNIATTTVNTYTKEIGTDEANVQKSITSHQKDYINFYTQLNTTCTNTTCPSDFATKVANALTDISNEFKSDNTTYQTHEKSSESLENNAVTAITSNSQLLFNCMIKNQCDSFLTMLASNLTSLQKNDYAELMKQTLTTELTDAIDKYFYASYEINNYYKGKIDFSNCSWHPDVDDISNAFFQNATFSYREDLKSLLLIQSNKDFCTDLEAQTSACPLNVDCYNSAFLVLDEMIGRTKRSTAHAKYLVDELYKNETRQYGSEAANVHLTCMLDKINGGSLTSTSSFTLILFVNLLLFFKLF